MAQVQLKNKVENAIEYAHQAEKLSLKARDKRSDAASGTTAVEAKFITPLDPVVETADGSRLPAVPLEEAEKLNALRTGLEGRHPPDPDPVTAEPNHGKRQEGASRDEENRGN